MFDWEEFTNGWKTKIDKEGEPYHFKIDDDKDTALNKDKSEKEKKDKPVSKGTEKTEKTLDTKELKEDLKKDGYTAEKVDPTPVVETKEVNKTENDITIVHETKKAFLLQRNGIKFWVQKRWYKDGKLTPAGERSYEDAEYEAKVKAGRVKFTPSWESEKAYGVDVNFDMYDIEKDVRIRVFIPKSMVENGTIPYWLYYKKMKEADQQMTERYGSRLGGWMPTDGFEIANSKDELYAVIDGVLYILRKEHSNAKDWAKVYKGVSVMYEGIAEYPNERVFLSKDTLKRCMPELKGRPVIIQHQAGITPGNMKEYEVGYVTNCYYNNETGDFDCDFVIDDDEAKDLLDNQGYTLSTSYVAKSFGNSGTFINSKYDKEITDLDFRHLAIVKKPRYERVKVYQNEAENADIGINEEKEYNMDKIEVEQGFLNSLLGFAKAGLQTFSNAKKVDEINTNDEDKEKEKDLADVLEKEIKEAEGKDKEKEKKEEEKENKCKNNSSDVDYFELMKEKFNSLEAGVDDKIKVHTRETAFENGKKIYG